jgi:plasmid stability protein
LRRAIPQRLRISLFDSLENITMRSASDSESKGGIMKSISIHGLDAETQKLIKKRAETEGKSVNKVVKELLEQALGLGPGRKDHRDDYVDLLGVWTEAEEKQFRAAAKDMETVNPADWK